MTDSFSVGEHTFNIYSLLQDRIIFLGGSIDSHLANLIMAQLLFLEKEDPEKDIYLHINSPGGFVSAGMGIFDTMNLVHPDVCTVCTGLAAGMGALLLSAGAKGKRMSLPSSRIILERSYATMIHDSCPQFTQSTQCVDIAIRAKESIYFNHKQEDLLAKHTGQPVEKIQEDTDSDFYMSAIQAKEYGLIDTVLDRRFSHSNILTLAY